MGHCRTDLVEKALLMNVPRTGDVPRREPASPAASAHLVGTLVAVGAVDRITALVGVRSVEETYLYWLSIYYKLINEIYTNKLHYLRRAGAMERIVGQTKLYFMET